MKRFLAVYTGSASSENHKRWNALDEKARKEREQKGMQAWGVWAAKHKDAIVFDGGPLGTTKRIDMKGVADINNQMAAYTVVRAESHEAAAKMFLEHPHFAIFPGDAVEIMEQLPLPGQK